MQISLDLPARRGVWTQVYAVFRYGRLTSQGTARGVSGGLPLTTVDRTGITADQAGLGNSGRVISPAPMRTQGHCVSQWPRTRMGRGEGRRTNRAVPGGWLSEEPATHVRGRARVIAAIDYQSL